MTTPRQGATVRGRYPYGFTLRHRAHVELLHIAIDVLGLLVLYLLTIRVVVALVTREWLTWRRDRRVKRQRHAARKWAQRAARPRWES